MRQRRIVAACAALAALCAVGSHAAARAGAATPLRLTAAFDDDATLGSSSALDVALRLDPRSSPAPLTEVRFEYPASLGIASSGLGLAACTRSPSDFAKVLITAPRLGGCPPNAVMGYGTARAVVRLSDGQRILEYATVTLLSGQLEHGHLGLVVFVDGQHPFGAKLAFAGEVRGAPAPYGGALTVRMPVIPELSDVATVSLVELRITIGSHAIRYWQHRHGQLLPYRPGGIALPARCPRAGFPFRAGVTFADGSRLGGATRTACPPAVAATVRGR
jgi:hypothetical protein